MRSLRRDWKGLAPPADRLRDQLQALELQAERVQQDAMLAFYRAHPAAAAETPDVARILVLIAQCTVERGRAWRRETAHLARQLSEGIGLESTGGR